MAKDNEHANDSADSQGYSSYGEASAAEVHEIMEAAHKACVPLIIWSAPGTGKSALVRAHSRDTFHGPAVTLLLATMDPTDVSGLPMRGETTRDGRTVAITEFGMPWWQDALIKGHFPDGEPCKMLFLDEFSNCPPTLQAAVLTLVHERILPNGEKLPDDVQIVMAANPESSATDYNPIASPMANRIIQISYKPTDQEFYEGFLGGWFTDEEKEAWSATERKWRQAIVDFHRHSNGAYILVENDLADGAIESTTAAYLNPDGESSDSEREILTSAWASPRSWDNLARMLGYMGYSGTLTPIQSRVASGMVGRKCEVELETYMRKHTTVNAFDVIADPESQDWRVDGNTQGNTYNDILELARLINEAVPKCDGRDGRPTIEQALDFYDKIIDLGGGAHFMTAFCQSKEGPGHYFKQTRPEGVSQGEWITRVLQVVKKFRDSNLTPVGLDARDLKASA